MARASGDVCLDESRKGEGRSSAMRPIGSAPDESGSVPIDYVTFSGSGDGQSGERMAIVVPKRPVRILGRYLIGDQIAAGGMATVHLGRLLGAAGFSRTVAVKKLHAHLARNPQFVQRFIDEARIASRIRHANVVQTLDIVSDEGELLLVLDYVHGESFAKLRRLSLEKGVAVPPNVASAIVVGVLRGLHAAHEAKSPNGSPLGCVHRDVSPQNILVGADGVSRVLDFGIAKAAGRLAESLTRNVKGKLAYMSPQQVGGEEVDRRADIFATGVVLWEALAGERLFRGDDAASTIDAVYHREAPLLAERGLGIGPDVDAVLAQALSKSLEHRFETADAMARALEIAIPPAHEREVAEWVERIGRDAVAERASKVSVFERADLELEAPRSERSKAVEQQPLPLRTIRCAAPPPAPDLDRTFQPPAKARRRDALMPPPMPEAESGAATVTEAHDAASDTDRQPAPPVSLSEMAPRSRTEPVPRSSSVVRMHTAPVPRPNPTPLVMMLGPNSSSAMPVASGSLADDLTRAAPITQGDAIARMNVRTPIPASPSGRAPMRPSPMRLALLVVIPPIAVAAALFGLRIKGGSDLDAGRAAAGAPPATMFLAADPPPAALTAPTPAETAVAPPPVAPPPAAAPPDPPTSSVAATPPPLPVKRTPPRPPPVKRPPPRPGTKAVGIPRDRN